MYSTVKYLHVTCVVLSVAGFFLRGLIVLRGRRLPRQLWIRAAPHVNDTVLLGAALTLAFTTDQYPFVANWVTAKVFGLIAYIILGSLALTGERTQWVRLAAWLAALATFGYVVSVALTKNPWGLLVWLLSPGGG